MIPERTRKSLKDRVKEPYFLHLDSLGWEWPDAEKLIRQYVKKEWMLKKASQADVDPYFMDRALQSIKTVRPSGLPQQRDGSNDCGCFCSHYGEKFLHRSIFNN